MNVTVMLFATLKDKAGTNRLALSLPGDNLTLTDLRTALASKYPALAESLKAAVAAINQEFAFADDAVHDGDEIAFFPPVSGGQTTWPEVFRVTNEALDL